MCNVEYGMDYAIKQSNSTVKKPLNCDDILCLFIWTAGCVSKRQFDTLIQGIALLMSLSSNIVVAVVSILCPFDFDQFVTNIS